MTEGEQRFFYKIYVKLGKTFRYIISLFFQKWSLSSQSSFRNGSDLLSQAAGPIEPIELQYRLNTDWKGKISAVCRSAGCNNTYKKPFIF